MGRAVKNSLEIVIKQVRLEGSFKRGGRIRVVECLRQIVPDRWASIRKRSFTKCFCVYTGGDKGSCVRCRQHIYTILMKQKFALLRNNYIHQILPTMFTNKCSPS